MDFVQEKRNKNRDDIQFYPTKAFEEYIAPKSIYKGWCTTFQSAMKLTITIGQCFALNPVSGVSKTDPSKLSFKLCSWRCMYTIISIMGQLSVVSVSLVKIFTNAEYSLSSSTFLVFSTTNCVTTILFLRLSTKWPRLCQYIAKTEAADPNLDSALVKRCNVSCCVILILALTEHLLSDLTLFSMALDCNEKPLYEGFITQSFPMLFTVFPYNTLFGIISQIINIQCAFNWNFADVFVICISLYLTSRLQQVNRRIGAVKGKNMSSMSWRILREDYTRVTKLVRRIDDVIGGLIFISFANNLFFICLQLLHTLADGISAAPPCHSEGPDRRPFQGYEHGVYFVYSFVFLVARSLAVSLVASGVHTASKEPAIALYDVSSTAYCIETQRFLSQVHGETVALSGIKFFNVTRGIVLSIAGTIVTYELVLMQFTGVTPTSSPV